MTPSSAALPSLDRKPGVSNWVDRAGGLPDLIDRIARHLHHEEGMTISRAIATAVSQTRKVCATGRTFGGKTEVKADTRARYCEAAKQWEAKKASTKLKEAVEGDAAPDVEAVAAIDRMCDSLERTLGRLVEAGVTLGGPTVELDALLLEAAGRETVTLSGGRRVSVSPRHAAELRRNEELEGQKGKRKGRKSSGSGRDFDESGIKRARKGSRTGGQFISNGASGDAVRAVQRKVGVTPDGTMNEQSVAAVRKFQRENGLQVDGVVGAQTAAALLGRRDAAKVKVGAIPSADLDALKRRGLRRRVDRLTEAKGKPTRDDMDGDGIPFERGRRGSGSRRSSGAGRSAAKGLADFRVDKGSISHQGAMPDGTKVRLRRESSGAYVVEKDSNGRWLPNRFVADESGRKAAEAQFLALVTGGDKAAAREQAGRMGLKPRDDAKASSSPASASSIARLRGQLGALPVGKRYSVVGGRGQPAGHVERTTGGYTVVLPTGTRTASSPGAAALIVEKFERQARANEVSRQKNRAANRRMMEAVAVPDFLARVQGLEPGELARMPDGHAVKHHATEDGRSVYSAGSPSMYATGGISWREAHRDAARAVRDAMTMSARSEDPASVGGPERWYGYTDVLVDGRAARLVEVNEHGVPFVRMAQATATGSAPKRAASWASLAKVERLTEARGLIGRQRRDRRGKYADAPDAPKSAAADDKESDPGARRPAAPRASRPSSSASGSSGGGGGGSSSGKGGGGGVWRPEQHPRWPKGHPKAGQFRPKSGGAADLAGLVVTVDGKAGRWLEGFKDPDGTNYGVVQLDGEDVARTVKASDVRLTRRGRAVHTVDQTDRTYDLPVRGDLKPVPDLAGLVQRAKQAKTPEEQERRLRAVGKAIADQVAESMKPLDSDHQDAKRALERAQAENKAAWDAKFSMLPSERTVERSAAARERMQETQRIVAEAQARELATREEADRRRREALAEALAEVRSMGGTFTGGKGMGGRSKVSKLIAAEAPILPSDWIEASNSLPQQLQARVTSARARYRGFDGSLTTSGGSTTLHELMHRMEHAKPELGRLERVFLERRRTSDTVQRLSKLTGQRGYGRDEIAYDDDFTHHYYGKVYDSRGAYWEVLSMGAEGAFYNRMNEWEADRDAIDFTLGVFATL